MRILQLLNSSCYGGIEAYILSMVKALSLMGHKAYIACRKHPPVELVKAMKARNLVWFEGPMGGAADFASLVWLALLRRRLSAEIIHAHQTSDALRAIAVAHLSGARAFFTRHCCYPVRARTGRALAKCHGLIAVSKAVKNFLVESGVPCNLVKVVYHGIEDPFPKGITLARGTSWSKTMAASETEPQLLGVLKSALPVDRITCAICARISNEKNQAIALDALAILSETRPDLNMRLIIAGRAYDRDLPYLDELTAAASRPPLAGRVEFSGHLDSIKPILERADIGLVTSRTEGLSYSLLEYMAAGLPVVSTPCEGPSEVIAPGNFGIVTGWDAESFARALETLGSSQIQRAAMGTAAREKYLEKFTLKRMVDETLEVYG